MNNGTINLGVLPPDSLSITGAYTSHFAAKVTGTLGPVPGRLSTNTVSGTSTIAGTVGFGNAFGFTPTSGQQFTILNYGNGSTVSAAFTLPGGSGVWTQVNSGTSFALTIQ